MQPGFRAALQPGNKWRDIPGVRNLHESCTVHWVNDVLVDIAYGYPLAADKVLQYTWFAARHAIEWVYSGKGRNFVAHYGFLN
jgi:hypothetical protein